MSVYEFSSCESREYGTVRTLRSESEPPYISNLTSTGTTSSITSVCIRVRLPREPPVITTTRSSATSERRMRLALVPLETVVTFQ